MIVLVRIIDWQLASTDWTHPGPTGAQACGKGVRINSRDGVPTGGRAESRQGRPGGIPDDGSRRVVHAAAHQNDPPKIIGGPVGAFRALCRDRWHVDAVQRVGSAKRDPGVLQSLEPGVLLREHPGRDPGQRTVDGPSPGHRTFYCLLPRGKEVDSSWWRAVCRAQGHHRGNRGRGSGRARGGAGLAAPAYPQTPLFPAALEHARRIVRPGLGRHAAIALLHAALAARQPFGRRGGPRRGRADDSLARPPRGGRRSRRRVPTFGAPDGSHSRALPPRACGPVALSRLPLRHFRHRPPRYLLCPLPAPLPPRRLSGPALGGGPGLRRGALRRHPGAHIDGVFGGAVPAPDRSHLAGGPGRCAQRGDAGHAGAGVVLVRLLADAAAGDEHIDVVPLPPFGPRAVLPARPGAVVHLRPAAVGRGEAGAGAEDVRRGGGRCGGGTASVKRRRAARADLDMVVDSLALRNANTVIS